MNGIFNDKITWRISKTKHIYKFHLCPIGGWMSLYWRHLVIDFWFWKTEAK